MYSIQSKFKTIQTILHASFFTKMLEIHRISPTVTWTGSYFGVFINCQGYIFCMWQYLWTVHLWKCINWLTNDVLTVNHQLYPAHHNCTLLIRYHHSIIIPCQCVQINIFLTICCSLQRWVSWVFLQRICRIKVSETHKNPCLQPKE